MSESWIYYLVAVTAAQYGPYAMLPHYRASQALFNFMSAGQKRFILIASFLMNVTWLLTLVCGFIFWSWWLPFVAVVVSVFTVAIVAAVIGRTVFFGMLSSSAALFYCMSVLFNG